MGQVDDVKAALDSLGDSPTADEARAVTGDYDPADTLAALYPEVRSGGGGGGSGSLLTAEIPLTNDDIKALGNGEGTSMVVVSAPAADKFLVLIAALVVIDASANPYGNIDGPNLFVSAGGLQTDGVGLSQITALLGGDGVPAWVYLYPALPNNTYGEAAGDQSIVLNGFNSGGPFTGGDPANSGRVKVWYSLEDLPS